MGFFKENSMFLSKGLFLSEKNEKSNRCAIFDEYNKCAYIYLTKVNDTKYEYDCFVYNLKTPKEKMNKVRDKQPPLIKKYANSKTVNTQKNKEIMFKWSMDGNAVCILINNEPYAMITGKTKFGFSISVNEYCPWAFRWEENIYKEIFG